MNTANWTVANWLQAIQIAATLAGFLLVFIQIRQGQKNAMMSSFLTAVQNHWMLIEDRRHKLRSNDFLPQYRILFTTLEKLLKDEYQDNLKALAEDFLWEKQSEIFEQGKEAVFLAIAREFAFQDLVFNLYEEEFIASKNYLKLVSTRLWNYWEFYMRGNFENKQIRKHWQLRTQVSNVYSEFATFVEETYLSSKTEGGKGKHII